MTTLTADVSMEQMARLTAAAGSFDGELTATINDLGLKQVAAITVQELVFRCEAPTNSVPVQVQLDVTHGDERSGHVLRLVAGEAVEVCEGTGADAVVRLSYTAGDLVRLLYGPAIDRTAGTHRSELLGEGWAARRAQNKDAAREFMRAVARAVDTVLGAASPRLPDLGRLAVSYGSDKWGFLHWFTPHYDRHFRALADQPVRVLEIGIGGYADAASGGKSLQMWKRYFRRGLIYGLDVFAKHGLDSLRLKTIQADQGDPEALVRVAEQYGPFDIVIDDGSHLNEHIITSFEALFPYVRTGGLYVIEDLWTSYCPGFGGADRDLNTPSTGLGLLKGLVDSLHHEERQDAGRPTPSYADANTVGLHVYHNIAFVEKGVNAEGPIPAWVPHSFDQLLVPGPGATAS